ncbi:MAG: hypothetical protein AAFO94_01075 [Bacteroidota bacterium]
MNNTKHYFFFFFVLLTSLSLRAQDGSLFDTFNNEQFKKSTGIIYGHTCGIAGTPPAYRKKLQDLIAEKDTETLLEWLDAMIPELQVYAAEGIYTLMSQGVDFDKEVYKTLRKLESRNDKISTCSGCILQTMRMDDLVGMIRIEAGF